MVDNVEGEMSPEEIMNTIKGAVKKRGVRWTSPA